MTKPLANRAIRWHFAAALALQNDSELATAWDALNRARGNLPLLGSYAIIAALRTLGTGDEKLIVGRSNGQVVAMVVVLKRSRLRWATFQPSQLPLGAWVASAGLSLSTLAHSLLSGPLKTCLVLSFTQVDPNMAPREPEHGRTKIQDYIDTAWVDIEGNFDTYWAARGKNLRQNMRKQRTKLAAEGIATTMSQLTTSDQMAAAIAVYGELESSGWKAQQGTAVRADTAQGHFYRVLLEAACAAGEAIIYQYTFNDKIVAMNLCLLRDGTLIVLKTAYDASIQYYSPAFLLREDEMREFHEQNQVKRVEYFGRVMDWHTKLTSRSRTLYHLTAYRWSFLKTLAERRRQVNIVVNEADEDNHQAKDR